MSQYNLVPLIHRVIVGFGPTPLPLTARTVVFHADDDEIQHETYPVVGFAVVHHVNEDGEVTDSALRPAVWSEEYCEALTVDDLFDANGLGASNERLIGIYPTGTEPPDSDVHDVVELLRSVG